MTFLLLILKERASYRTCSKYALLHKNSIFAYHHYKGNKELVSNANTWQNLTCTYYLLWILHLNIDVGFLGSPEGTLIRVLIKYCMRVLVKYCMRVLIKYCMRVLIKYCRSLTVLMSFQEVIWGIVSAELFFLLLWYVKPSVYPVVEINAFNLLLVLGRGTPLEDVC